MKCYFLTVIGLIVALQCSAQGDAPRQSEKGRFPSVQKEQAAFTPYAAKPGDRVKVVAKTVSTTMTEFVPTDEKQKALAFLVEQKTIERREKREVYVAEVVEIDPLTKSPTKLNRTFEFAEEVTNGKHSAKLPHHGKTLELVRKGASDVPTFVDGSDANDFDGLAVLKFINNPQDAKGDWNMAPMFCEVLEKAFEFPRDHTKGTAKLIKNYEKNGVRFGVIQGNVEAPLQGSRIVIAFRPAAGSTIAFAVSGDGCWNGANPDATTESTLTLKWSQTSSKAIQTFSLNRTVVSLPRP